MQPKKKPCDGDICKGKLAYIWKNELDEDGERLRFCQACWNKKNSSRKPTIKRQDIKRSTTPIKKFSDKRQRENVAYSALRKVFLLRRPNCEMRIPEVCTLKATEVHHPLGRIGERFLDDSEWIPGCHSCHSWVELHPLEAKELGLSKSRLKTTKDE